MVNFADGADVSVFNVASWGGDNMSVRKFNRTQPTVARTPAAVQLGQQPETQDEAARQASGADLGQNPETDGDTCSKSREGRPHCDVRRLGQPVSYQSWERLLALGELKLEVLDGQLSLTAEQLRALGGLLLESLGTDAVLELTGASTWRAALDELDKCPAGGAFASAPCGRPGWTVFEKVTQDGLLPVPAQVRHALGLPAGGWLAFFASVDGQIVVMAKDSYRARFGPGLDAF